MTAPSDLLRAALLDADPAAARRAGEELAAALRAGGVPWSEFLLGLRDPDPNVRRRAHGVVARCGPAAAPAREAVRDGCADPNWTVREAVVEALAAVEGKDAEPVLAEASLFDPDPRVRRAAVRALAGSTGVDPAPYRAVEGHYRWKVRQRAALALGALLGAVGEPAVRLLCRLLDDPNQEVRRTALASLDGADDIKLALMLPRLVRRAYEVGGDGWPGRLSRLVWIDFSDDPVETLRRALPRADAAPETRAAFDAFVGRRLRLYEPTPQAEGLDALLEAAGRRGVPARREAAVVLGYLAGLFFLTWPNAPFV